MVPIENGVILWSNAFDFSIVALAIFELFDIRAIFSEKEQW